MWIRDHFCQEFML